MMIERAIRISCPALLTLVLSLVAVAVRGAGTPGETEAVPDGLTADEGAVVLYRKGLDHKAAAHELEAEAQTATGDAERLELTQAALAEYRAAVDAQGRALKLDLDFHEAANELGYALRRTGDYTKALGAYNFALMIKPDFYPAVEYRGEAYLALGMLDEAKGDYLTLFRNEPVLAARLLAVMATTETDDAFQRWVVERQRLAAVTPGAITDTASAPDW